jgi:type II secretory pathway pseudopilin PulG
MHRSLKNLYPNKRHRYGKASLTAGFTLVEMIVAIGVFMISVIIIVGSLISLNNASRKARTERIAMDNLSAAIDSISRSVRMGTSFHCGCGDPTTPGDTTFPATPRDCPLVYLFPNDTGGDRCLAFKGQGGDQIIFRFFNGRIQRSINAAPYLDMTAPEITITNLKFYLRGSAQGDQPVISMMMRGASGVKKTIVTDFHLQTTVVPRTPNF